MNEAGRPVRRNPVRRFFQRLILLVLIPLVAVVVAIHFYFKGGRYVTTENAYVKSHIVAISSDIDGRVVEVNVADNETVEAGALLFRVDPEPFALRVAEAEAEMAMARQEIESLQADYRESRVAIEQERENVRFFTTQLERQQQLQDNGAGSVNGFEEAQHNLRIARQRVAVLGERATQALARLGGDSRPDIELHPSYIRAKSRRDQAAVAMQATSVRAPSAGIVSNMQLQVGEYVNTGVPVFSLLETDRIWVQANLKETQLTHIQGGQSATFTADAFPQYEWQATVASIAPATGAEFALLPPQNATGNWVKVVQRIPVELFVERRTDAPDLRAGMTVSVKIDTNRQRQPPEIIRVGLASDLVPAPVRGVMYQVLAIHGPDEKISDSSRQSDQSLIAEAGTAKGAPDKLSVKNAVLSAQPSVNLAVTDSIDTPDHTAKQNLNVSVTREVDEYSRQDKGQQSAGTSVHNIPALVSVRQSADAVNESDKQTEPGGLKREPWLMRQAQDQFMIQVSSSDDLAFLKRFAKLLPAETPSVIYHYKYNNNNQPEYGLASGVFDSRAIADSAIDSLAEEVRRYGPWVRRIGDIQRALPGN